MTKKLCLTIYLGSFYFLSNLTAFGQANGLFDLNRSWIGIQSGTSTNYFTVWDGGSGNIVAQSLGTGFTSSSDSLLVKSYDVKTWKSGGGDITGGVFYWTVYEQGNRPGSISYNSISLGYQADLGGGNQQWGFSDSNTSLLSHPAVSFNSGPKTYTFEFYVQVNGSPNTLYDNNNGNSTNYTASFATVPEPSSASLIAMGAAGLLALRRRRNA